ncbi:MAG: putative Ig domain-containing protein, partial [Gemmatales bacterium]|nr:putative Ig domain-containing protein [Gemmatales bacterium]
MPSLTVSLPELLEFHEGQYVHIQPNVYQPPERSDSPLTFSASGLPEGLSLDPSTGVISGLLPHSLADRFQPLRQFELQLLVTDGTETAVTSTTLTIQNVDYVLASLSDQSNFEGDSVSLDLRTLVQSSHPNLALEAPLLFSAGPDLPPGLSLDPHSGTISGTIAQDALSPDDSPASFSITVALHNLADGDTSTISFHWLVHDSEPANSYSPPNSNHSNSNASVALTNVTDRWLSGFEDEPLSNVAVVVFKTDSDEASNWSAIIHWGDGSATPGQIVPLGNNRFQVLGDHTYDRWGFYLVRVSLSDNSGWIEDLYNVAVIQFRHYVHTVSDPLGNTTQFVFTEGFRLTQVLDPLGNSTYYTYTDDGHLASRTDPLGRVINFAYDDQGRLISQTWLSPDGSVVDTLTYSYDADGRLLSASNHVGTYTLHWTDNRLTIITNPFGIMLTFSYDDAGRRTSLADSFGGLVTSVYTDGRLTSRSLVAGDVHLRVDFTYDSEQRLT